MIAVIWAAAICVASSPGLAQPVPQYGHKAAAVKGPRALALIQLPAKGKKGRIIPIAVMMDGKFFDAGSYKAAPVPMALDFGTVYEGFRNGVSQGVFTVTQPGQLNHVWIAEGTWLPAGEVDPHQHKKYSAPVIADDDKDGTPVLHRRSEKTDSDGGSDSKGKDKDDKDNDQPKLIRPAASTPPATSTPAGTATPADSSKVPATPAPSDSPKTTTSTDVPKVASSAPATAPSASRPSSDDEPIADPNRPRLRRGKPEASAPEEPFTTFEPLTAAAMPSGAAKPDAAAKDSAAAVPVITFIPAISDAGGPDPRPYAYDVKPQEEADYRSKMLDLAAAQVRAGANAGAKDAAPGKKASASKPAGNSVGKSGGKLPKPAFDDVSLHIFDLSNSNQPVLVLSAKTHPPAASAAGSSAEPQEITLIARTNLDGDLQKLFFSETDARHLDVNPRMEFIDAVDADGDGRGELLFRRTFDDGSAYAIYRVTTDRLWPLFEGTP